MLRERIFYCINGVEGEWVLKLFSVDNYSFTNAFHIWTLSLWSLDLKIPYGP